MVVADAPSPQTGRHGAAARRAGGEDAERGAAKAPRADAVAGRLVASLVEDRSRTVALVLIDTSCASSVEVHSFVDAAGYPETLELLETLVPDDLLMPQNQQHGVLATKAQEWAEARATVTLHWMSIRDFDQTAGAEMLRSVVCGDSLDPHFCQRYTVLAGAYCALRFAEKEARSSSRGKAARSSSRCCRPRQQHRTLARPGDPE